MERLYTRLQQALQQRPLDIDFLEFLCTQEMVFINTITSQIEIPQEITDVLAELSCLLWSYRESQQQPITALTQQSENVVGRPRLEMSEHYLVYLLEMGMPATVTANVLGVSRATLYRRMNEVNISVRRLYSTCTNHEHDEMVSTIKTTMPNSGYRLVKGALLTHGHRVQWDRVRASMHRVDTHGVLSRLTRLGCVVRRTYSVPCPKYLVHIDTNHKLIR